MKLTAKGKKFFEKKISKLPKEMPYDYLETSTHCCGAVEIYARNLKAEHLVEVIATASVDRMSVIVCTTAAGQNKVRKLLKKFGFHQSEGAPGTHGNQYKVYLHYLHIPRGLAERDDDDAEDW